MIWDFFIMICIFFPIFYDKSKIVCFNTAILQDKQIFGRKIKGDTKKMCYFEDCEDRYWPREDNTPDCPYEDCDNSTDTGNTNPGGTGTTNPGSAIFVSATATTVRTESAARPGTINPAKASACMTLLIPTSMHGQQNPRSYLSEPTAKLLPSARAALISAFAPAPIPRSAAVYASLRPILLQYSNISKS